MEKARKAYQDLSEMFSVFCDDKPLIAYYIKLWSVKKTMKIIEKMTGQEVDEF